MFCYGNDKMWCSSNANDGLMVFCDVLREGHLFRACALSADVSICSCLLWDEWDEQKLSDAPTDLTWADEAHGEPSIHQLHIPCPQYSLFAPLKIVNTPLAHLP